MQTQYLVTQFMAFIHLFQSIKATDSTHFSLKNRLYKLDMKITIHIKTHKLLHRVSLARTIYQSTVRHSQGRIYVHMKLHRHLSKLADLAFGIMTLNA
jgi:hypothetical protein